MILLFSKTSDYRHDSIPAAVAAVSRWARGQGIEVEASEDAGRFSAEQLARFRAVVWLSTSGRVLDDAQRRAFERFVAGGGAYVGIHAASATELDWPWYAALLGARFIGHPEPQRARVVVEDTAHPATRHLPASWWRSDEWYEFDHNPRTRVRVLLTVDESTYDSGRGLSPQPGGQIGGDHPLAWCQERDRARSFYTALGHSATDYEDPMFLQHVGGGILWALGAAD